MMDFVRTIPARLSRVCEKLPETLDLTNIFDLRRFIRVQDQQRDVAMITVNTWT
jgi:hypothetical protein